MNKFCLQMNTQLSNTLVRNTTAYSFYRYIKTNARMSSAVVDTLTDSVPIYLHNRPHWFVRHCIGRMRKAEELQSEWVSQLTDDAYQVNFSLGLVITMAIVTDNFTHICTTCSFSRYAVLATIPCTRSTLLARSRDALVLTGWRMSYHANTFFMS